MFCESEFLDVQYSWNTTDPDFTPCFQKTVLLWLPCFYLLFCSPVRILMLYSKDAGIIPWSWKSRSKLALAGVLSLLCALDIVKSLQEHFNHVDVPLVDFVSPLLVILTMVVFCLVVYFERKSSMQSSGFLLTFWFILFLVSIVTFRSKIRVALYEGHVDDMFRFITFYLFFAVVLVQLVIACLVDNTPVSSGAVREENPCPEHHVSFLSQITFWWFTGLVVQGYKRALVTNDLWNLNPEDRSSIILPLFNKFWQKELHRCKSPHERVGSNVELQASGEDPKVKVVPCEKKKPRLFRTMIKAFGWRVLVAAIFKLIFDVLQFVSPLILKAMINYATDKSEYTWRGYFYAVAMLVVAMFQSLVLHQYFHGCAIVGMRLRTSIIGAVYEKMLKLSNSARKTSTVGEIVNLMSVDAQRFMDMMTYINMIWSGPFQIIISIYLLWMTLGPSILAGVGTMIIMIPINAVIANKVKEYQVKQMQLKDQRIKMMNEILNGIKVLKLYAWEGSFEQKVLDIRNKELGILKKMSYLNACTTFTWTCAPFAVCLMTFAVYVMVDSNNILDAEKAFVSLSLFNILRFPLSMVPQVISNIVQVRVSLTRLRNFLGSDELDENAVQLDDTAKHAVQIENGDFSWDSDGTPALSNIQMSVPEGSLVAVVGTVGAGKSSLLQAILGEMEKVNGKVTVKGSVAYVAQQAWIQNATLQDNILFGSSSDLKRYRRVIEACALQQDLEIMPAGDKTEIGEKGINLSGGQKQRVSLARAVYQDRDLYLLDDPLSAVDSHVGKHIFDNVIGPNGVLKGKTRVLVTHGIGFLPQVDMIMVLVNGKVSEVGTYQQLLTHDGAFAQFLKNYLTDEMDPEELDDVTEDIVSQLGSLMGSEEKKALDRQVSVLSDRLRTMSDSTSTPPGTPDVSASRVSNLNRSASNSKAALEEKTKSLTDLAPNGDAKKEEEKKLIEAEAMQTGSVKLGVFGAYLKSVGIVLSTVTVLFYVLFNVASVYSNIWLSQWSNDAVENNGTHDPAQRDRRLGVYGALGLIQGVLILAGSTGLFVGNVLAGRIIHARTLRNIIAAPMSFFDETPVGRILNRFGNDLYVIDTLLAINTQAWIYTLQLILGIVFVIAYSTPVFLAVALPLGLLYMAIQLRDGSTSGFFIFITLVAKANGLVAAGHALHLQLLANILRLPMTFFDTNPVGRLVNRFSRDMDAIDIIVPETAYVLLHCVLENISMLVVITIVTPVFLVAAVPLLVLYTIIQRFYVATSRQLKRLESVSRSPIYSHFGETVTGATTVRAYHQQERFIRESETKVDENLISHYPSIVSNRWLAIRLEFVGNCIVFFACLFAVISRNDLSPGIVGLSITYALSVTQTLNWMVRMTTELETNIVAVERVKEYSETPTEAAWVVEDKRPGQSWPVEGEVVFDNYGTRYREGLDLVIKGISCTVQPGEKVGIVGRTGAGKSSLTLALFRIIEPAVGKIKIDGIDIESIGLHDLRSKLTIIPQEPVLFSGTLRMNLDPFDQYSDELVWQALEHAHLKTFVSGLAAGLEHECSEGGENLSVGQRQLVCLARALLRKTKILILDEATAAVDLETDDLIQHTIRVEFESATVLTIAHRLNTIMDYTRVMVLDEGRIVEFENPQSLLQRETSIFYGMAKDAGLVA